MSERTNAFLNRDRSVVNAEAPFRTSTSMPSRVKSAMSLSRLCCRREFRATFRRYLYSSSPARRVAEQASEPSPAEVPKQQGREMRVAIIEIVVEVADLYPS